MGNRVRREESFGRLAPEDFILAGFALMIAWIAGEMTKLGNRGRRGESF